MNTNQKINMKNLKDSIILNILHKNKLKKKLGETLLSGRNFERFVNDINRMGYLL